MSGIVYTEGFPPGWRMEERSDCTLLLKENVVICTSPKLVQGKYWLNRAQQIAYACYHVTDQRNHVDYLQFCDHCGVGPRIDDDDVIIPRPEGSWQCDYCDKLNIRFVGAQKLSLTMTEFDIKQAIMLWIETQISGYYDKTSASIELDADQDGIRANVRVYK